MALVFSEETGIFVFVWHDVFASFGDSPRRWGAALDTRTGATAARAERVKADIVLYIAYRCAHCASKMSDASPETASFNSCAFPFSSPWLVFPRACSSRERGTPSCGTDEEERGRRPGSTSPIGCWISSVGETSSPFSPRLQRQIFIGAPPRPGLRGLTNE